MSRDRRCKTKCCQLVARCECLSTLTSFIHCRPFARDARKLQQFSTVVVIGLRLLRLIDIRNSRIAIESQTETQQTQTPISTLRQIILNWFPRRFWPDGFDLISLRPYFNFGSCCCCCRCCCCGIQIIHGMFARRAQECRNTHSALFGTCSAWFFSDCQIVVLVAVVRWK